MVSHFILISNVLPPLSCLEMRTSSGRKSPNLCQQKSPNLNLATGFMKNVKQWKGLRWWEVEHSLQEGPCELSQRPREKPLKRFSEGKLEAYGLRFYLPPPEAFPLFNFLLKIHSQVEVW